MKTFSLYCVKINNIKSFNFYSLKDATKFNETFYNNEKEISYVEHSGEVRVLFLEEEIWYEETYANKKHLDNIKILNDKNITYTTLSDGSVQIFFEANMLEIKQEVPYYDEDEDEPAPVLTYTLYGVFKFGKKRYHHSTAKDDISKEWYSKAKYHYPDGPAIENI